ncbi:MAG: Ig-like domain-containing protein, partial [Pseudomonadota bacterium]
MTSCFGILRGQHRTAALALATLLTAPLSSAWAASDADASWIARSTHPDVVMATRFDTAAEVFDDVHPDSRQDQVFWERNNRASGEGSMRIEIYKTDGAAYGSWRRYLADDQREFDEGDEFYVQFRQYIPAYMATHRFLNGNGWKQAIISHMSGSNQLNEVVLQNTNHRGLVQGYNRNIGGGYPPWDVRASTACSSTDFRIQNAVDNGPQSIGSACENDRARYGGLFWYYSTRPAGWAPGEPDPLTGGFIYYPDEWLTFLVRVRVGTYGQDNHLVQVWAARDGGNYEMLIDRNDIELGGGSKLHNTIWLLPFNTNTDPDPSREDTYTLYDELIVSTSFIASPAAAVGNAGPQISLQADPLTVNPGSTTELTWDVVDATSCDASGGWNGPRALSGNETSMALNSDTQFTLTCTGPDGTSVRTVEVAVVAPDAEPPTVTSISANGSPPAVRVRFSEPVEPVSATTASNYQINSGVTVQSVEAGASDSEVVLTTSAMIDEQFYTLTVNNVTDQSVTPNSVAMNTQVQFVYDAGVNVSGLSRSDYEWGVLNVSEDAYIDRDFIYSQVPEDYAGLTYLRTANDDKLAGGDPFLTFTVDRPVTVYLGLDVRAALPTWMQDWSNTGDQWITNDSSFDLYEKSFPAGEIALGSNGCQISACSMYTLALRRELSGGTPPGPDETPVAVGDTLSVTGTEQGVVVVLQNDLGLADTPLTLSVVDEPSHGIVKPAGLVAFSYIADDGFSGVDQFTYRVTDADGDFDEAVVTVQVAAPDTQDAVPVAVPDTATTPQDVAVDIAVLDNDTGLDDLPVLPSVQSMPAHGSAFVLSSGAIRYTPDSGFAGGDTFTYRVTDADGDFSEAAVTVTVAANPGTDNAPLAVNDAAVADAGTAIAIDVLANDGGLLDTPIQLAISSEPTNGTVAVLTDQTVRYTSVGDFSGTDSFGYTITDADGDTSTATVFVTVTGTPGGPPGSTVPVAVGDSAVTPKDVPVTIDVMGNDAGLTDAPVVLTIDTQGAFGTATVEPDNTVTYMPDVDYVGQDSFVYRLVDADGDTAVAVVAITVNDVAP